MWSKLSKRKVVWTFIFGLSVFLGIVLIAIRPWWLYSHSEALFIALWLTAVGAEGIIYYLTMRRDRLSEQVIRMTSELKDKDGQIALAYHRLDAFFEVGKKFVEAGQENEVIDLILRLSIELLGARGASYVPLDEHGQPSNVINQGELPSPGLDAWLEYLASPAVRDKCGVCERNIHNLNTCPLMKNPYLESMAIYCVPLKRGDREFGVLNLYMPDYDELDQPTRAFLGAVIEVTALALEGIRLRQLEMATLSQIQTLRQKTELRGMLNSLLDDIRLTLEADFGEIYILDEDRSKPVIDIRFPDLPTQTQPFIDGILHGVIESGEVVFIEEVGGGPGIRSLVAVPLTFDHDKVIGAVFLGYKRHQPINQRLISLLQTIAGQTILLVQNVNQLADIEYKATIQERKRLAREIHDGLAQTLGYLKIQAAQMKGQLTREEYDRLSHSLNLLYENLNSAYLDARQTIDGLRINPDEQGLGRWLDQIADDFEETNNMVVELSDEQMTIDLPPEVLVQLIRVVQESLSNIRKHADADKVWIDCFERDGDILLEVRDNGKGFLPEDLTEPSRHGLRGIRERAELIGPDFQIISQPEQGTCIRIRLPVSAL